MSGFNLPPGCTDKMIDDQHAESEIDGRYGVEYDVYDEDGKLLKTVVYALYSNQEVAYEAAQMIENKHGNARLLNLEADDQLVKQFG